MRRFFAYLWPLPYTIFGIAVGLLLGARFRRVEGVIEIHGPLLATVLSHLPIPALAMTMGHVVFGQTEVALDITRRHERVHTRQYERWGPMFVPAYLGIAMLLYIRGRDGYRENPFEIEAYAVDEPQRSDISPG
jgi:hypothetical protein